MTFNHYIYIAVAGFLYGLFYAEVNRGVGFVFKCICFVLAMIWGLPFVIAGYLFRRAHDAFMHGYNNQF